MRGAKPQNLIQRQGKKGPRLSRGDKLFFIALLFAVVPLTAYTTWVPPAWLLPAINLLKRLWDIFHRYPPRKSNFFISYHSADRIWSQWVAGLLEANNYSVTYPGWKNEDDFVGKMDKATTEAEYTWIILSPDYWRKLKQESGAVPEFKRRNKRWYRWKWSEWSECWKCWKWHTWCKKPTSFNVHKPNNDGKLFSSHVSYVQLAGLTDETQAADRLLEEVPSTLRGDD